MAHSLNSFSKIVMKSIKELVNKLNTRTGITINYLESRIEDSYADLFIVFNTTSSPIHVIVNQKKDEYSFYCKDPLRSIICSTYLLLFNDPYMEKNREGILRSLPCIKHYRDMLKIRPNTIEMAFTEKDFFKGLDLISDFCGDLNVELINPVHSYYSKLPKISLPRKGKIDEFTLEVPKFVVSLNIPINGKKLPVSLGELTPFSSHSDIEDILYEVKINRCALDDFLRDVCMIVYKGYDAKDIEFFLDIDFPNDLNIEFYDSNLNKVLLLTKLYYIDTFNRYIQHLTNKGYQYE